jgi:hypothetical protein
METLLTGGHGRYSTKGKCRMMKRLQQLSAGVGSISIFVAVLVVTLSTSCHPGRNDQLWREDSTEMKEFTQQLDRLYQAYLGGDSNQGRSGLQETILRIENAKLSPHGEAHGLFLTYCRLSVLEKKAGNEAASDINLLKARYWFLRRSEIDGDSAQEISGAVKMFTFDKAQELVEKLDKHK